MPSSVLDTVKRTPGVKEAEGSVSSDGLLLDKHGKAIVSSGPPTLIVSRSEQKVFRVLDYESGGPPGTRRGGGPHRGPAQKNGLKGGASRRGGGGRPAGGHRRP